MATNTRPQPNATDHDRGRSEAPVDAGQVSARHHAQHASGTTHPDAQGARWGHRSRPRRTRRDVRRCASSNARRAASGASDKRRSRRTAPIAPGTSDNPPRPRTRGLPAEEVSSKCRERIPNTPTRTRPRHGKSAASSPQLCLTCPGSHRRRRQPGASHSVISRQARPRRRHEARRPVDRRRAGPCRRTSVRRPRSG